MSFANTEKSVITCLHLTIKKKLLLFHLKQALPSINFDGALIAVEWSCDKITHFSSFNYKLYIIWINHRTVNYL